MIILQDNFYDNRNNWFQQNSGDAYIRVEPGAYTINHNRSMGFWSTWKSINLNKNSPFTVEARIQKTSESYSSCFGLVWGLADINYFHYFLISSACDQYYIGAIVNGQHDVYGGSGNLPFRPPQYAPIIFKFTRLANGIMKFQINNREIRSVNFKAFYGPNIGFYAGPSMKMRGLEINVQTGNNQSYQGYSTSEYDDNIDYTGPRMYQTSDGRFTPDYDEWIEDRHLGGISADSDYWITHSGDE